MLIEKNLHTVFTAVFWGKVNENLLCYLSIMALLFEHELLHNFRDHDGNINLDATIVGELPYEVKVWEIKKTWLCTYGNLLLFKSYFSQA